MFRGGASDRERETVDSSAATKADVSLPRAHRNMLQSNKLKIADTDATGSNAMTGVCIVLHGLILHVLKDRVYQPSAPGLAEPARSGGDSPR